MQDYTIGENYVLPSLGKVYNEDVNPNVKLRSMTTEEEMKRVSSNDLPYQNMCEIIDDCLVEKPGISAYDMCIGDYQFLLHRLRVVTYGPDYHVVQKCNYCGSETEDIVNLDELPIIEYTEEYEKYREFDLPKSGRHIRLRPQTPRMLDKIISDTRDYKRRLKTTADPSLIIIAASLIETIDGGIPNPIKIEDWIRSLPMADMNVIIAHAEKMNEAIGVDVSLRCTCDVCGMMFDTTMKTTQEFFRPALDI